MGSGPDRRALPLTIVLLAALGCLQAGIDPVFLTLLSAAHPVRPADHGWIVGATQAGMAIGSLIGWRAGSRLPRALFPLFAIVAVLASVETIWVDSTRLLLCVRAAYGLAMGLLYTDAMSRAATGRPNGAYGAVFLTQLILSTVIAILLPALSDAVGARFALAMLCVAPVAALMLALSGAKRDGAAHVRAARAADERHPVDAAAWALALATFLFICATMMVWSFTGAMAVAARISEDMIGQAVAIGSIAGAATALCVMRERPVMAPPLTGVLAGSCLLAPIAATHGAGGDPALFILSVVLLNIGSTAIIIRGSGLATARSEDPVFRRLVTCTHSGGMIAGPVIGSIATAAFGTAGLLGSAIAAIMIGCIALLLASRRSARVVPEAPSHQADGALAMIV